MERAAPGDSFLAALTLTLLSSVVSNAAMANDRTADLPGSDAASTPRWLMHLDVTGVFPHPSAGFSVLGNAVPDASLTINSSATVTGDLSYFLAPHIAVNLYTGVPASGAIRGSGSLAGAGTLARSRYGPVILSAEYRFTNFGAFRPYAGVGPGYTIFPDTQDGALRSVRIANAWGAALSLGADYAINARWTVNAFVRQMWLSTTVTASFAGAPAAASVTLNPTLCGAGFGYRF